MNAISKRIKEAVEGSPLTYSEIDEKLEMPVGTCEKWVQGKDVPDTPTVKRLAEVLGVTADKLLFGVERIGEMKAMFPNDADPAPTPMSDWRFLAGAVMVFVGAVGILMMVMRYSAEGYGIRDVFETAGLPAFIFAAIAVSGAVLCIVNSIVALRIPKQKKGKKNKNEEK